MKPATGLALIIGGAVVLYAAALALGFKANEREGGRSLDDIGGGWQDTLGKLAAWFAPRLDVGPPIDCNGQPVDRIFKLAGAAAECELRFPGSAEHDYRRAELTLVRTPATDALGVYVRSRFDEEYFPRAERDPETCLIDDERLRPFRLEIRYEPNDEGGQDTWECWLVHDPSEPFALVVLRDGGSLSLRCVGCADSSNREVMLRMR